MKKVPFVTLEKLQEINEQFPTPFHLYDEKGIRENAKAVKEAFDKNKIEIPYMQIDIRNR